MIARYRSPPRRRDPAEVRGVEGANGIQYPARLKVPELPGVARHPRVRQRDGKAARGVRAFDAGGRILKYDAPRGVAAEPARLVVHKSAASNASSRRSGGP